MTQHPLKRRRQIVRPDKITLPVVHLGASLKPENNDIDELWTYFPAPSPLYSKTSPKSDKDTQTPVPKSLKHKNIFELSKAYKTSLPLNKGYWKIPGLSTNLIGFHSNKESLSKTTSKEKVVYERKFRNWYHNCLHDNAGRLPPIHNSRSTPENVYDATKAAEKKYISRQIHVSSPLKRFSGSEVHLPKIYSNCLGCKECRRIYTSEIFTENYLSRNDKSPVCCKSPDMTFSSIGRHHCDVLGERYCKDCIERRNKRFSRKLEDTIISLSGINNTHYSPAALR